MYYCNLWVKGRSNTFNLKPFQTSFMFSACMVRHCKPPSRCEFHLPLGPCLHVYQGVPGPFCLWPFWRNPWRGWLCRTGFVSHTLGLVFQFSRLIHTKTLKSDSAKAAYQITPSRMPLAFFRNTGCPRDESGLCVHLSFGGCVPNWACLLPTAGCVPTTTSEWTSMSTVFLGSLQELMMCGHKSCSKLA
jgi:hypothetical protein